MSDPRRLLIDGIEIILRLMADIYLISPPYTSKKLVLLLAIPTVLTLFGCKYAATILGRNDAIRVVFLIVMAVLFFLGFVLVFLEIIYIVILIVGPAIYGGAMDPKWVTTMIAINLQTSFLTPPFGFTLFYLRGVAPPSVPTGHIYRGVIPFVIVQVLALAFPWVVLGVVTIVSSLIGN